MLENTDNNINDLLFEEYNNSNKINNSRYDKQLDDNDIELINQHFDTFAHLKDDTINSGEIESKLLNINENNKNDTVRNTNDFGINFTSKYNNLNLKSLDPNIKIDENIDIAPKKNRNIDSNNNINIKYSYDIDKEKNSKKLKYDNNDNMYDKKIITDNRDKYNTNTTLSPELYSPLIKKTNLKYEDNSTTNRNIKKVNSKT